MPDLMVREYTASAEWNHSCTSQCSQPCTVNLTEPDVGAVLAAPVALES